MSKQPAFDSATHYRCSTGDIFARKLELKDRAGPLQLGYQFALVQFKAGVPATTLAAYFAEGQIDLSWFEWFNAAGEPVNFAKPQLRRGPWLEDDLVRSKAIAEPEPEPPATHTVEVKIVEKTERKDTIGIRYPIYLTYSSDDGDTFARYETITRVDAQGNALELHAHRSWRGDETRYEIEASKVHLPYIGTVHAQYFGERTAPGVDGNSYGFDGAAFDALHAEIKTALCGTSE